MSDKVTVRFESTMDSANSEPLLLSGPIQIFGYVDRLDELSTEVTPDLMEAIQKEKDLPSIIVFVNEVGNDLALGYANNNSQPHRGAYFLFVGDRNKSSCTTHDWQEILLGTHSHENKAQLDSLANLELGERDRLLAVDSEGNFKLVDNIENAPSTLPPLPPEFQNKLTEIEYYKSLNEPTDSEWHHLDADLSELDDTYDWLKEDNRGQTSFGNCRQLYHSLIRSDKKLYFSNGELSRDEGTSYFALEAFNVNFDSSNNLEKYDNVIVDPTNTNRLILKVKLPCVLEEKDEVFLFLDGKILSNNDYLITKIDKNEVTICFNRNHIEVKTGIVTALISRGTTSRMDIIDSFESEKLKLEDINSELIALYIEGEFNRKPYLPKLYLSTDQYGNINWENKLLPSQAFLAKTKTITKADFNDGVAELKFEDVYFNSADGDFIILMEDSFFAFDLKPKAFGKDLIYEIPFERISSDEDSALTYTLLVIRETASDSHKDPLMDRIARNYVSKEDAIKILSNGKISLNDYAKSADLIAFSKIGHTHNQYALRGHDHDHKYANYRHTHPELVLLLQELTETEHSAEEIDNWVNDLTSGITDQVEAAIKNSDVRDFHVLVTSDIIELINNKIESENYPLKKLNNLSYLDEVLLYLGKFFEHDTVRIDQVVIPYTIPVKYKVGGITKSEYAAGTSFEEILQDIINPYVSDYEIKEILTPSKEFTYIRWYRVNVFNEIYEVDPLKLKYDDNNGNLLFKVFLRNSNNEPCEYTIVENGNDKLLKTKAIVLDYPLYMKGELYYIYDSEFNFKEVKDNYSDIKINWLNEVVRDNYGRGGIALNPENKSITIFPEFDILFADYLAGSLYSIDLIDKSEIDSLKPFIGNNKVKIDVDNKNYISIFIDSTLENFKFIETSSRTDITGFFDEAEDSYELFGRSYTLRYYEVLNAEITDIELEIIIEED